MSGRGVLAREGLRQTLRPKKLRPAEVGALTTVKLEQYKGHGQWEHPEGILEPSVAQACLKGSKT